MRKGVTVEEVWESQISGTGFPFAVRSLNAGASIDVLQENIMIYTEGWQEGEVAAVLRGGTNAMAVLEVLACAGVEDINIFHLEEKIPYLEEVFISSVIDVAHAMFDHVSINWRRDHSVYDLVKKIGRRYKMLFFGAPLAISEIILFYQAIKQHYDGSVTIVKAPAYDIEYDEADEIYKWLRRRTFEAGDFASGAVLRKRKKELGEKIAVILPTLNEERTVGNVISTALEVKGEGIIDEIIVIDSSSVDKTVAIAESYGIPVYLHSEIETQRGSYRGKGEAMYKSIFVTDANILAWVDTDIENIRPSFFYGLLGPLLTNPEIRFSKGYFNRPVRVETSGLELGGGRVTEIFARPWINAFLPQLSGYIQPLSGTVAIYRDEMLKMRIPANYGVEIAMLIQAVRESGLWSTCQVNLGEVVHKSKDVVSLSEMSFQIMQVLIDLMGMKEDDTSNRLRRFYYSAGRFEMSSKRFKAFWRTYGADD